MPKARAPAFKPRAVRCSECVAEPLPRDSVLAEVGRDLTCEFAAARGREGPPIVGFEDEVRRVFEVLGKRRAANVIIVGEPGVGKTALAEAVAQAIVFGEAPAEFAEHKLVSISLHEMYATTTGSAWNSVTEVLRKLRRVQEECQHRKIILFYDEIHMVWYHDQSRNALKDALAAGRTRMIGATTPREYHQFFEKDPAMSRRFEALALHPPGRERTVGIVRATGGWLEGEYEVRIDADVFEEVVDLSDRCIFHRHQPAKALDLVEGACVRAAQGAGPRPARVDRAVVCKALSERTGIPDLADAASRERFRNLADALRARVLGQDEAIDAVARRILVAKAQADIQIERPDGVFLFAGPTGVGKTELARALAEALTGSAEHFLKVDMSRFKERDSVSILLGPHVSYHAESAAEPSLLTIFARQHPHGVLVLDEIEKAHREVWTLFLSVFDDGKFVDAQNVTSSFAYVTIVMTTNLGFSRAAGDVSLAEPDRGAREFERRLGQARKEIETTFPREFLGRVDEVVFFKRLDDETMGRIVRQKLGVLERRLEKGIELDDGCVRAIVADARAADLGARTVHKIVERRVSHSLAAVRLGDDWDRARAFRFRAGGSPEGPFVVEVVT